MDAGSLPARTDMCTVVLTEAGARAYCNLRDMEKIGEVSLSHFGDPKAAGSRRDLTITIVRRTRSSACARAGSATTGRGAPKRLLALSLPTIQTGRLL